MTMVRRINLDVLKPHEPNILEFASRLAETSNDCDVAITVLEMDEHTETLNIVIEGEDIQFDRVEETIKSLGGSLHSIDEVLVSSTPD